MLWPPTTCLQPAIELLQSLHCQRGLKSPHPLTDKPPEPSISKEAFLGQLLQTNPTGLHMETALVTAAVVQQHVPTVWFCHDRNPVTSMLCLLFSQAGLNPRKMLHDHLTAGEFRCLEAAIEAIAGSPLILAEAGRPGWLTRVLPYLAKHRAVRLAILNTPPSPSEARRLSALSKSRPIQCITISTILNTPTQYPPPHRK